MEDDAIGYIRAHSRTGASAQRSALNKDGCRVIIEEGKPAQNRNALELLVRHGTKVKVYSLWLVADPSTRRKPGGWRKDLLSAVGRLRKRGGIIIDVSSQLRSDDPEQFSAMLAHALEKLANNGRTVHLQKLQHGRRELVFSADVEKSVELLWRNVRDYPHEADVAEALKKVAKDYTTFRARRKYGARKKRAPDAGPSEVSAKMRRAVADARKGYEMECQRHGHLWRNDGICDRCEATRPRRRLKRKRK